MMSPENSAGPNQPSETSIPLPLSEVRRHELPHKVDPRSLDWLPIELIAKHPDILKGNPYSSRSFAVAIDLPESVSLTIDPNLAPYAATFFQEIRAEIAQTSHEIEFSSFTPLTNAGDEVFLIADSNSNNILSICRFTLTAQLIFLEKLKDPRFKPIREHYQHQRVDVPLIHAGANHGEITVSLLQTKDSSGLRRAISVTGGPTLSGKSSKGKFVALDPQTTPEVSNELIIFEQPEGKSQSMQAIHEILQSSGLKLSSSESTQSLSFIQQPDTIEKAIQLVQKALSSIPPSPTGSLAHLQEIDPNTIDTATQISAEFNPRSAAENPEKSKTNTGVIFFPEIQGLQQLRSANIAYSGSGLLHRFQMTTLQDEQANILINALTNHLTDELTRRIIKLGAEIHFEQLETREDDTFSPLLHNLSLEHQSAQELIATTCVAFSQVLQTDSLAEIITQAVDTAELTNTVNQQQILSILESELKAVIGCTQNPPNSLPTLIEKYSEPASHFIFGYPPHGKVGFAARLMSQLAHDHFKTTPANKAQLELLLQEKVVLAVDQETSEALKLSDIPSLTQRAVTPNINLKGIPAPQTIEYYS